MKTDKNLSQYVSSAPMALSSYNDFATRDKHNEPFKQSKGLTPVFKLILNSQSAVNINNTYVFNNLDLSSVQGKIVRAGIASIIANGNIVGTSVFNIHLNPLIQSRSYDTRTRGITDMIYTGRAGTDYIMRVNQADCNIEIDADAVRRTNSLSIYFTDLNNLKIASTATFQITLYIYEAN